MARGQIAKPEFYVDYFLWLNTIGSLDYNDMDYDNAFTADGLQNELISSLLRLDPNFASPIGISGYEGVDNSFTIPTGLKAGDVDDMGNANTTTDSTDWDNWNIDYVAFLNHNFKTALCDASITYVHKDDDTNIETAPLSEIINYNSLEGENLGAILDYDGYSIMNIDSKPSHPDYVEKLRVSFKPVTGNASFATSLFLGGVSIGHKYTLPQSPDMRISMQYDAGYKRKDTINGRKVAHLNWFRERGWTQFGIKKHAFNMEDQVGTSAHRFNMRKSGRRTWSISYSYISDDDMFPTNMNLTTKGMDDNLFNGDTPMALTDNNIGVNAGNLNIMSDRSLVAQLLHRTCFGYLPFLFRPDNTYARADGFCIAMLDMKKFSIKQVAHKMWSVKLKIVEVI